MAVARSIDLVLGGDLLEELHELVGIRPLIDLVGAGVDLRDVAPAGTMGFIDDDAEVVARQEAVPDILPPAGDEALRKVYEVDPFLCPECGGKMTVIAVTYSPAGEWDPAEIRGIIACLAGRQSKIGAGWGPPH